MDGEAAPSSKIFAVSLRVGDSKHAKQRLIVKNRLVNIESNRTWADLFHIVCPDDLLHSRPDHHDHADADGDDDNLQPSDDDAHGDNHDNVTVSISTGWGLEARETECEAAINSSISSTCEFESFKVYIWLCSHTLFYCSIVICSLLIKQYFTLISVVNLFFSM